MKKQNDVSCQLDSTYGDDYSGYPRLGYRDKEKSFLLLFIVPTELLLLSLSRPIVVSISYSYRLSDDLSSGGD